MLLLKTVSNDLQIVPNSGEYLSQVLSLLALLTADQMLLTGFGSLHHGREQSCLGEFPQKYEIAHFRSLHSQSTPT